MSPEAIRAVRDRTPFAPFCVQTADGRTFVVPRPDSLFVYGLVTCLPTAFDARGDVEGFAVVTNDDITAVVPLANADASPLSAPRG